MVRLNRVRCVCIVATVLGLSSGAFAAEQKDVPGSHDHPLVSRFEGASIIAYEQVDYDAAAFPLGPHNRRKPHAFEKAEELEGRITRIGYVAPKGKSGLEVFRNFESALKGAGFDVRFTCAGKDGCGGFSFASAVMDPVLDGMRGDRNRMIDVLDVTNNNVRALTAHLERPNGPVDLSLLVGDDDRQPVGILLQVVEGKAMATGQVTIDAKAMGKSLANAGHIALYGIHFATDSATLKDASDDTLAQMASLLQSRPSLKVYIVGHTDNTGVLAHNKALSQQRAESVVKALEQLGIAGDRLRAEGLASFAPVASNDDEDGRARNRRVELVEQ